MRSSRRARDSSWRTRSRVMPRPTPTSSSVCGDGAVEAEALGEDVAHARVQAVERVGELGRAEPVGRLGVGPGGLHVLDHVAVEALAVADGRLEADGILDELEQLAGRARA